MGKREKEHRAKVAKRNQKIATEKSKMQKAFDALLQAQIEKFKESSNEDVNVEVGGKPIEFSVVDKDELTLNTNVDTETIKEEE